MMTDIFLKLVSMSLMASYCVLLICIVRFPLRRVPKTFSYLLWSIVAVRLLCPFSLESNFSLVGEGINAFAERVATTELSTASAQAELPTETQVTDVSFSEDAFDLTVNQISPVVLTPPNTLSTAETASLSAQESSSSLSGKQLQALLLRIAAYVWLIGMAVLFGYCIVSYLWLNYRLKRRASYLFAFKRIPVYGVKRLDTPFVLGLRKPAIYLPTDLNAQESEACLAHEYTHIRRKDHLIKQFAFLLACVYWFQPLVWLAFYLMVEDMEMSCDEIALRSVDLAGRKAYSNALVRLSSQPKYFSNRFLGCPLAFGENNVSGRIKNILNLKKPALWVLIGCGVLLAACTVGLLTDPADTSPAQEPDAEEVSLYDPPVVEKVEAQSDIPELSSPEALKEISQDMKENIQNMMTSYLETGNLHDSYSLETKIRVQMRQLAELKDALESQTAAAQKAYETALSEGAEEESLQYALHIAELEMLSQEYEQQMAELQAVLQLYDKQLGVIDAQNSLYQADSVEAHIETLLTYLNGKNNVVDDPNQYAIPYYLGADVSAPALVVRSTPKEDGTVVGTLSEGDFVDIVAFGSGLLYDRSVRENFLSDADIMAEYQDYAMITYSVTQRDRYGQQLPFSCPVRVGYVKIDGLDLSERIFNTPDTYRYWIGKVWSEAFCLQDEDMLSRMAAKNGDLAISPMLCGAYYINLNSDQSSATDNLEVKYVAENQKDTEGSGLIVLNQSLRFALTDEELKNIGSLDELLNKTVIFSDLTVTDYQEYMDIYYVWQ